MLLEAMWARSACEVMFVTLAHARMNDIDSLSSEQLHQVGRQAW